MAIVPRRSGRRGAWILAVSVPVETVYSWRGGLTDLYYLVKVVGWALLAAGAMRVRRGRSEVGQTLLAGGWGWLAANFWRRGR
jgi:hypothetical protein